MKKSLYIIVILITICFMTKTYNDNNKMYDLKIKSYNNSYVESFAKKNKYNYENLSDSEFQKLNQEYSLYVEIFDYNETSTIEITGYKGITKNLIIPNTINGKKVTSIKSLNNNVKTITISKNITNIDLENIKNIEIKCYQNDYCNSLLENKELKVEQLNDSTQTNFKNTNIDFEYNIKNNEIEVTSLNGEYLIIPETINGMKITTISLNIPNMPTSIYLPSNIEKINGISSNINNELYTSLTVQIITLLVALIILFVLNNKKTQTIYITSIYMLNIIYLLVMNFIAYNKPLNLISLSIIITLIYLIITISVLKVQKRISKYDEKIKNINDFKNEALKLALKTNNNELIETIKYMDPVSNDKTKNIEEEILNDLKNINDENQYSKIVSKIKERNEICKNTK